MTRGPTFPMLAETLVLAAVAGRALVVAPAPDTYRDLRRGAEIWKSIGKAAP